MLHFSVRFVINVIVLCGNLLAHCEILIWKSESGHHMVRAVWMAFMSPGYAWSSQETCDDTAALWRSTKAVPDYSGLAMRSDISH